jgi:hypothetical protein
MAGSFIIDNKLTQGHFEFPSIDKIIDSIVKASDNPIAITGVIFIAWAIVVGARVWRGRGKNWQGIILLILALIWILMSIFYKPAPEPVAYRWLKDESVKAVNVLVAKCGSSGTTAAQCGETTQGKTIRISPTTIFQVEYKRIDQEQAQGNGISLSEDGKVGTISGWGACEKNNGVQHFEQLPGYEYRCIAVPLDKKVKDKLSGAKE